MTKIRRVTQWFRRKSDNLFFYQILFTHISCNSST